jgi:methionyl-tRNA synthetase
MSEGKKHTVTAALPYANGPIHIGHLAGCHLPADIYARFLREEGKDVLFICGSDEHGVPITLKAKSEGKTPQELVDQNHKLIGDSLQSFGISFDIYSRTTNKVHHDTAQEFFKNLYEKGAFIEKESEQYYDEKEDQFLADRYIRGECPICGFGDAYGDQCENCGSSLSPMDLINPKSAISGNAPVRKTTKNWFLPLDKIQEDFLNDFIASKKDWKSNVLGQCKSWLKEGLHPRAMTRDLNWGVPVPVEGADGKVMYVWFDAPIGYISFTKEARPNNWKEYWDENAEIVHFLGKDNIVFHCIIFPAMLWNHGGYGLPKNVPANEFLNLEGDKISTSRNWAIWLHEYVADFPGREDELRYVLTSIAPETKDSEFTWKDYQARVNNELVAILGNFVNRVMVLNHKYFDGAIQAMGSTDEDKNILSEIEASEKKVKELLYKFRMRDAQQELMNIARIGNKFLADTEPWHLIKTDEKRVGEIMALATEICRRFAIAAKPFLPSTSTKMQDMLNVTGSAEFGEGHVVAKPQLLFKKIEDSDVEVQLEKLKASTEVKSNVKPMKETITYDEFVKMDIRVGTILEAERVPKTDKLLKLLIDTGLDQRTVVSGIAVDHDPAEIVGKQVSILVNLAPRKIRGIESQGMILMAEDSDGSLKFAEPSDSVDNGSVIA